VGGLVGKDVLVELEEPPDRAYVPAAHARDDRADLDIERGQCVVERLAARKQLLNLLRMAVDLYPWSSARMRLRGCGAFALSRE
jgi:hypothetical protein